MAKHGLGLWLCCALMLVVMPTKASAVVCMALEKDSPNYDPHYYSVSREFRRSRYVVRAKIVREIWLGEDGKPKPLQPPFQSGEQRPRGLDPYLGTYYDVRVETAFKGRPPPTLRLFSENSTARFWFDIGSEWVLFVTDETFDQPIGSRATIDTCGSSSMLPEAGALLRAVQKLKGEAG